MVRSLQALVVASLVGVTGVGAANAGKIAVADVAAAEPELEAIAGALTVVLRTYVGSKSQRIDRASLERAVLTVTPKGKALTARPTDVGSLLALLAADKWLAADLSRAGTVLVLHLVAFDRSGSAAATSEVRASLGDYDTLAREAATEGARLVGSSSLDSPALGSYANLAAVGRASARLGSRKIEEAALELAAAPVRLGFELDAARGIAAPIIADPSVALDLRMNAALVAGDMAAANKLADEASGDPRSAALLARVKIMQLDYRAASKALAAVKRSSHPFVELARAALAGELGRPSELAASFRKLLAADVYLPALALAATLRPGALGDEVEAQLLKVASRIAAGHPLLASQLAARALRGGARDPIVFELIDPLAVTASDLRELKGSLEKLADEKLKGRLSAEIAIREGDLATARMAIRLVLNLEPDNKRAQRVEGFLKESADDQQAAPAVASASKTTKAELLDPKNAARLKLLADDVGRILAAFPVLSPELGRVVLVRRKGTRAWALWPTRVHPDRLRQGLEAALGDPPYRLQTSTEVAPVAARPSREKLAQLAADHDAGAVLVYGVASDGMDATIDLLLYAVRTQTAEVFTDTLADADQHGVVSWNPLFVGLVIGVLAAMLLWLIWLVVRGTGTVRLELKGDPAAERPSFSVLVSRRNRCPTVTDPKLHIANVTAEAKAGRYRAHNVGAVTEFERVPPGSWFVHVYGTFEKAGETRCLPATTAGTKVRRSRASVVNVDLTPTESEFHVLVSGDGGPAAGSAIWLSTNPAKRYVADVGGKAVVFAPPGEHTIHITNRGTEVTRKLNAYGSKVTTVHINMVRERRLAEVADGLELQLGATQSLGSASSGASAYSSLSEETPTPRPAPLLQESDLPGPSVESFREAAVAATTGLPSGNTLTGLLRYRAGEQLGRGAMGVVYRAIDQVLDRPVALKVMSQQLRENPAAAKMFEQEAKALAALNHPNVVAVYDQGRDEGEIFMVMELVAGQTLEQVLEERGKLPLLEAANVGEQLGRSLSYAHSRRVIHRDIKPANIFLTPGGTVKLGDFGLARVLNEVQIKQTEIKGTPLYMSPEQIRGSDIDFRADIYALGCTMYEVLAGRPPFIEGEILWHHMYTEPEPLSTHVSVPAEVEQLIMRCIAKEKSDRIASADRISEIFGAVRRALG